jgi:hypothetical protein
MATEKQIASNRANAQKSTGPRTPEGKSVVARNAMRHLALARYSLLRAECRDNFNNYVADFYAEYNPRTATERALVDAMAAARWKSLRISTLESAQIDYEFDRQTDPSFEKLDNAARTALAYREASLKSGALSLFNRTEARLQRQFDAALNQLRRHREDNQPAKPHKDQMAPPAADPKYSGQSQSDFADPKQNQ